MTELQNILDSKTMTLKQYLSISDDDIYEIPFTQRNYEWGKPEISRLFNDFVDLFEGNEDVHPLNIFTMSKNEDSLKIYDGQQRTITCLLFLSIISQQLFKIGDYKGSMQIQSEYFVAEDDLDDEVEDVKKLYFDKEDDSSFFYKITDMKYEVDKDKLYDLSKNSNKRALFNGYILLNDKVINYLENNKLYKKDPKKILHEFYKSIVQKNILIRLVANNEDIASNMFESLNNTGKDLEKYYVLKNDVVRSLGESEVRNYWDKIDQNLMELSHNQFLIDFATLFNGKTTNRNVLDAINRNFEDDKKELLEKLLEASDKFLLVGQPSKLSEKGNKNDVIEFRKLSKYIAAFKVTQHYPIILSMLLKNMSIKDINSVLWAVLVLSIRNFYFNEDRANTIETPFATYANQFYNDQISTKELINKIKSKYVEDYIVKNSILSKHCSNNNQIKTILTLIYNKELENSETEIQVEKVDLEHILPKKPNKKSNWIKKFPELSVRKEYTYKIGNLTLLLDTNNRSLGNKDFSDKKVNYKDSKIKENIKISNKDEWNKNDIKDRSKKMSDVIVRIFK